jgi:uncharacterized protein (DUF1697 family)
MPVCISFLRGVNMAGHNTIKMADLALLYKELGFRDAITFIQSGNVIFTLKDEKAVSGTGSLIENAILKKFSFDVPVMMRTVKEISDIMSANPFLDKENFDPAKMAVIFLHEKPQEDQIRKLADVDYPPDKFKVSGSEIFIYCPNGFGRTKLYTNFFEKKMDVRGTGRNWNTITTILNLAENL